ncbi:MAG: hypothetical protein SGJ09_06560 [Phycisphaerae bacterium]|nr:hypothetical protein [Phycisphaerae bacterium]
MFPSLLLIAVAAFAQNAPRPAEDLPWPAKLGLKALSREIARPIARQVVLVPDAATYLDEISKWTPAARWPVLFDDDTLVPMFVRGFKPERVVRRKSIGALPSDRTAMRKSLTDLAVKAIGVGGAAPCVAITSVDDPAWTAAAALAAGRGMPIAFVDGTFGAPDSVIDAESFARLSSAVDIALDTVGLPWRELGDDVDAVAFCRSLPARAKPDIPALWRPTLPANAPGKPDDPCATIDALVRKPDGSRSAVVGWIFGTEARCAYMAMSSMFLLPKDVMFVSGYAATQPWEMYDPTAAADMMKKDGFDVAVATGAQASLTNWLRLLMGGLGCDVLVMNSSGDPDWFNLAGNDRGRAQDMPIFDRPAAVHLVHSWSLTRPDDRATVGGRLLEHGVYAYVGAVQEPFLTAFVTPSILAQRVLGLGPFLVSSRILEGPFDRVWRITLIGDPLCMLVTPAKRVVPSALLPELAGLDVLVGAKAKMKTFAERGTPDDARAAMRDLVALGEEKLAIDFWRAAVARGAGVATANAALGPLFRARGFEDFLSAFAAAPTHSDLELDMLWHLATPRVLSLREDALMQLRRSLRAPSLSVDLERLLPGVDRAMGRRASDAVVHEELDKTTDPGLRERLSALLRR